MNLQELKNIKPTRTTHGRPSSTLTDDVLKNIRAGNHEYCYFAYQIIDLLKFHFDDLKTKYCDGYWDVWLEKPKRTRLSYAS